MSDSKKRILILSDVDGTLTPSGRQIDPETSEFLFETLLKARNVSVGLVSGSNMAKIERQMGGSDSAAKFDYVFAENGLVAYKRGRLESKESIRSYLGEETSQRLLNFCLAYMSNLDLPCKTGNFIEYRDGLINICPVGRSCSLEQRLQFAEYDQKYQIRKKFRSALIEEFSGAGLDFAIGGQISIDVFPVGWDKRFCLNHVQNEGFDQIHFFGDKTHPGGNDHELYEDPRTIGHRTTSPEDTLNQMKTILNL